MIDFNCICHYRFSVPAELAGDTIQCPECRRLNDVPTPAELERIAEDGGYKFDEKPDPKSLDTDLAIRAYSRGRNDPHGAEIDMRQTFDDVLRAGVHVAQDTVDGFRRVTPKYDPSTGELIRAIQVRDEEPSPVVSLEADPGEIPLEAIPIAPKILGYARTAAAGTTIAMAGAYLEVLKPANLVVIFFVFITHLLVYATGVITLMGFIFTFIAPTIMLMGLIGHYGNVIEEIGPGDRDEIPVPLRSGSIFEDIWMPFVLVLLALFLAFFPLILLAKLPVPRPFFQPIALLLALIGTYFAPAILLTMVAGGVVANLRPDRIISVIRICGFQYWIAFTTFLSATIVYAMSLFTLWIGVKSLVGTTGIVIGVTGLGSGTALMAAAIYLMHVATFQIGLLYRAHHETFPWIMQRHESRRLAERNRPAAPQTPR